MEEEEEKEALARFCRLMISRLRHKRQQEQQQPDEATGEKTTAVGRGRGRVRTEAEGDTDRKLRPAHSTRQGGLKPSTDLLCRGLEVQAVPLQLISTLRLRRLREEMERVRSRTCVTHFYHMSVINVRKKTH